MSEHFSEQKKIWEQQSEKVKERFPERKDPFTNLSGIPIEPLYVPETESNFDDYA